MFIYYVDPFSFSFFWEGGFYPHPFIVWFSFIFFLNLYFDVYTFMFPVSLMVSRNFSYEGSDIKLHGP